MADQKDNKKGVFYNQKADTTNQQLSLHNKGDFMKWFVVRSGKITTALYLVSDCLPDHDPLRGKLRACGVSLVSDSRGLYDGRASTVGLLQTLSEMHSLLDVASGAALISEMNYRVLSGAICETIDMLTRFSDGDISYDTHPFSYAHMTIPEEPALDQSFFDTNTDAAVADTKKTQTSSIGHLSDREYKKTPGMSDRTTEKKTGEAKEKPVRSVQYSQALEVGMRLQRRKTILKILKDNDAVSIKDISSEVTDCSEKTIQRTLKKLMADGLVKKTGKRRWSRYQLTDTGRKHVHEKR